MSLKDNTEILPAKDYGYWSVRWSGEGLESSLAAFAKEPFASVHLFKAALAKPFHAKLLLLSLSIASHWAFAAAWPWVSNRLGNADYKDTIAELQQGAADGVLDIVYPNGDHVPRAVSDFVKGRAHALYKNMILDLNELYSDAGKQIIPRLPSAVTVEFLSIMEANFKVEINQTDRILLSPFIDEFWRPTVQVMDKFFAIIYPPRC